MKKDTVASLYKHSGEQDQSRAKPKFHRCENTDRVMSKKKKGGGKRKTEPQRGMFHEREWEIKVRCMQKREFLGAATESWGVQLPHLSGVLVCCAFALPWRSR